MLDEQWLHIFFDGSSSKFVEELMLGIEGQGLLSKLRKSKERCLKYNTEDIYNIYINVIKKEYQRIRQEPPSIGKPGYEDEIKQEPLSPMQIDVSKEEIRSLETSGIKITYEKIIVDEYRKINVKSEQMDPVKQEQDLTDSEESKEKDIKIIGMTKLSYLRLLEWLGQHISFFSDELGNALIKTNFLRWTEDLVIDKKETAKLFVDSKLLDNCKSYELACLYCLEDSIRKLWDKELGEEEKRSIKNKESSLLTRFWTIKMAREEEKWIEKNYECLLESSVEDGNEVAVEYLLNDLSKLEQKPTINFVALAVIAASTSSSCSSYTYYTPVLCKLLRKMSNKDKDNLYEICCYDILNHLVTLRSGEYDKIVEYIWNKYPAPQSVCQALLANVASKVAEGDSSCQETFMKFWKKINEMDEKINRAEKLLSPHLFQFDKEKIKEILGSATSKEKEELARYVRAYQGLPLKYCTPSLLALVAEKCFGVEKDQKFMEDLILSGKGLEICTYLVSNDKFEKFKEFFNMIPGNKDEFKKLLFKNRGRNIFVSLCTKDNKGLYDKFLKWYFSDESDIDTCCKAFKKKLVLSCTGMANIMSAISNLNNGRCKWQIYQKELIKWGDLEENNFRTYFQGKQLENTRRRNVCVDFLLDQAEGELAGEFLNWCFSGNKNKIDEFKKDFTNGNKAVNFCINKIKAGKVHTVKNFLEWVNISKKDREELLKECKALLPKQKHKEIEDAFGGKQKKRLRESTENAEGESRKKVALSDSPGSSLQKIRVKKIYLSNGTEDRDYIVRESYGSDKGRKLVI
ncbi:hypothetical protein [Wolbachia endosymbiont of Zygogramma bicolorata]|uniref:hypothetical protein n=1 Tax=Wolbachia endosymbiont of Zygogramma bicolorata TaxID=3134048 RepID=UPI003DA863AB